jgi:hypothetical protein
MCWWPDILELHPRRLVQLQGVRDVIAPPSHQLCLEPSLFPHLAQRGLVGQLVLLHICFNLHTLLSCASAPGWLGETEVGLVLV